ncbi:uncharacterized protein LOC128244531 [Mya arenaria]|uniref:uncharacterized protein LOC128244531 n=1 Tax=Mya arenaria TaxID=6604 RepID=UPI0022E8AF31|nr:uncharacterized protein LOC128244531 [Mya arenaria]
MSGDPSHGERLAVEGTLGRRTYASQGTNPRKRYNVGLFGCGRIAGQNPSVHLKNILSNRRLDLTWIVENDARRIQEVKDEFYLDGNTPFFPFSERNILLSDKSLDAVVVVSPTSTHTEYIVQSLKNVLVSTKLKLVQLLFTSRKADYLRKRLNQCGQPDSMAGLIKYPDGVFVTMDVFRESVYGYDIRLEAFGTGGMALAENPRESSTVIDGESCGSTRRLFNSFPQRFEAPFAAELDHFINCMDGNTTPLVTKEESLCVAVIIEKGVQSYREKRVVYF